MSYIYGPKDKYVGKLFDWEKWVPEDNEEMVYKYRMASSAKFMRSISIKKNYQLPFQTEPDSGDPE